MHGIYNYSYGLCLKSTVAGATDTVALLCWPIHVCIIIMHMQSSLNTECKFDDVQLRSLKCMHSCFTTTYAVVKATYVM